MHYAPHKPLYVVASLAAVTDRARAGALVLGAVPADGFGAVRNLSPGGDVVEAAGNLFSMLHELDREPGVEVIYALRIPEDGIGLAVMDRIYKASQK